MLHSEIEGSGCVGNKWAFALLSGAAGELSRGRKSLKKWGPTPAGVIGGPKVDGADLRPRRP